MTSEHRHTLQVIPLLCVTPGANDRGRLVIFLPGFSGDKESCLTWLQALAELGYTALSFDPWQHSPLLLADSRTYIEGSPKGDRLGTGAVWRQRRSGHV